MREVRQTMENFERMSDEMDVVLFGGGEWCMRFMNRIGERTDKVKCILDNDTSKVGNRLYGKPVCTPESLREMDAEKTLVVITVAGNNIPSIYNQILGLGEFFIMSAIILMHDTFMECTEKLYENRDKLEKVKGFLFDEKSKYIYGEVIRRRLLYGQCDFSDLLVKGDSEYIIPLLYSAAKPQEEVILDCGAYNGDTLKKFAHFFGPQLKRCYSFECMPETLVKLENTAASLGSRNYGSDIKIMPYALSDSEGEMSLAKISSHPVACCLVENRPHAKHAYDVDGYEMVKVGTIDTLIPAEEKVTLIKMDIEGSEYAALKGAARTIQTWKPKLAISIYHSGEDYYRLPLLVKEFVPEYKIAVRHHSKNTSDTDMYCWI